MATINPGTVLPNGATVVAHKPGVILALWISETTPYVTWGCNDDTLDCYWGHYFDNFASAVKDFDERSSS